MSAARTSERSTISLPTSPQKTYKTPARLGTDYEEEDKNLVKSLVLSSATLKRQPDLNRKSHISKSSSSTISSIVSQSHGLISRGRANTDTQTVVTSTSGLKQQSANASGIDRIMGHYNQQHQQQPPPSKPKCTLPASKCQSGYITASKLFNMMGYGLQNQYLFMHAHYLYIIDCRSREEFDDDHILTAIHWEDALNGTVYISLVERFSEIVLYDEKGIASNMSTEMRQISNRFSPPGSRPCVILAGGFETFHTLYPFNCTQKNVRSTVDREKFLTIYPSVVLDNQLYLGTGHQATNWKVVRDLQLTHIINISIEHQCVFPDKIKYLHLELEDKEDVLLKDRFDETIRFMDTALQNPSNRILVHCNLGISRSTTLILAYLMKTYNATLYEAFRYLRHRRPIICPNWGFLRQLLDYENHLFSYVYTDPKDPIFH
ncbi:unnamed protein product [Adineta steineri]|uniref:protein-tyrosine-phosphatase n=1 Tax=Adineta steineri TaxID=433720 RepID=A0A818XTQ7_9BILA|nr:unnamed protein product [Adineta steineri]CAF3741366.1 unnamed protein product [Adineta steineri]